MKEYCIIDLNSPTPIVCTAIHDGHKFSDAHKNITALSDSERLQEEDPFTREWAKISDNQIIGKRSRFEFDLNRAPEKAIYVLPSDAWGLNLWKKPLPAKLQEETMRQYADIYKEIHNSLYNLIQRFGKIVILDIHSYNHRRGGPEAAPEDPANNPEVNIGTGTMDREYWAPVVDRFINDLQGYDFQGRKLDVRENVKFRGGYFPKWIHSSFEESACCISVEFKKFFMDEWTGEPDWNAINSISEALTETLPGLLEEISMKRTKQ